MQQRPGDARVLYIGIAAKNRTNNYLTVGGSSWSIPKQMAAAARLAQASMTTPDLS
jgi:hypothetical protein